jgi:hypothetical protein
MTLALSVLASAAVSLLFGRHALSSRPTIWRRVRRARRNGFWP